MKDPRAMTRVLDELLWSLRREGISISTAQAIDAARVAKLVGFVDKDRFRDALAATVVTRLGDRARFDRAFAAHFRAEPRRDLWERLGALGFTDDELALVRATFAEWASTPGGSDTVALLSRGSELDRLMHFAGVARAAGNVASELQLGFATFRALAAAGLPQARTRLSFLRSLLTDALGARGDALATALTAELDAAESDVRAHFSRAIARREESEPRRGKPGSTPFVALDPVEIEEVRRAVRRFAERLRGGARVRRRRAKRGKIDPHRTLRGAMRTFGAPFRLYRRDRRRDRPRLLLLCDVSDSVRAASSFMLELVHAAHDLFDRTRSFVFVSDVAETTTLFENLPAAEAMTQAYARASIAMTSNSNYGRALRNFEAREARRLDRRTTVVVLGDGRTNFSDDGAEVLRRLRDRVKAIYWLSPESRSGFGVGDSAMLRYEPYCTRVLEVRTARELEDAARLLVRWG